MPNGQLFQHRGNAAKYAVHTHRLNTVMYASKDIKAKTVSTKEPNPGGTKAHSGKVRILYTLTKHYYARIAKAIKASIVFVKQLGPPGTVILQLGTHFIHIY